MSYCRFSSDDYQCDVYVYEDCSGGYTTHVAGNKVNLPKRLPLPVDMSDVKKYLKRHKKLMKILRDATREKIDNQYAGETFNDATPGECADRLEVLRASGLNVPQYAIDALREEASECSN